jgi:hypothetical protein
MFGHLLHTNLWIVCVNVQSVPKLGGGGGWSSSNSYPYPPKFNALLPAFSVCKAMSRLRRLVSGLLLLGPGFNPKPVHAAFVALGQVFPRILRFFLISIISLLFSTHISFIYHRHCIIVATDSVIKYNTSLSLLFYVLPPCLIVDLWVTTLCII